jgi:F0F1-type ATP synthase assembly protein I
MNLLIAVDHAAKTSPQPIIVLMLTGFGIGIFGYLSGYKIFVAIGIALVFVAGLLAPQF